MVLCYEGTPGSGKCYDAIVKIIDNLRLGRIVYTNISGIDDPVCREHIKLKAKLDDYECSTHLVYLSDLEITQPQKHCKPGALLVIDEVHKRLNARDWQSQKNKEFADWGSTHRHGGFDVLLITQGLEKVDSQVRGLVEFTHRYKKNNYFGSLMEKQFLVKVYEEDSTKIIGKRSGKYDKSIYKCYKSYVTSDIQEMKIQSNVNILKHPIFYSIPVLLLIFGYYFSRSSFASGDWFGTKGQYQKKVAEIEKSFSPVVPAAALKSGDAVKVAMYERKFDSTGKPVGDIKRVLIGGTDKVKSSIKRPQKAVVKPLEVGQVLSVRNYQGFVSSGNVLYVLIGSKKTSLSQLKIIYPDAEIIDGSLRLSGTIYSPGQTVPL